MRILARIVRPLALALLLCAAATAAEPEFVGILAVAVEDDVARELKITEGQKTRLLEFIDAREAEAVNLSLDVKDLSQTQRRAKMAGFRRESEERGLQILDAGQVAQLKQIDAGRKAPAETDPPQPEEPPVDDPTEETAETEAVEPADPAASQPPRKPGKLRFSFRYQPWKDVLDWFAQQADLSLVLDAAPQGTFNYVDDREYTPAEAIDLLNGVLLTKGYTLVRRGRMLMLINLEDGIPPNLVPTIPLEQLDEKGEFELVSVLFDVDKLKPEEAELELKKLAGPQGSVVALAKSRQILATETAGRLRAMRSVIQRAEDPQGQGGGQFQPFELKFVTSAEAMGVVRQLLDIPEDKTATPDGSIRIAIDPSGGRLLVTGREEMLARMKEILAVVDVPGPGQSGLAGIEEVPQLEVYTVSTADPESVLAVMQTLMSGLPDVRLASDPKTGHLVALARPSQHKTIRATLDQLQRDARQIEVMHLRVVDPQLAVLSINKLFGSGGEEPDPKAPQVDADPTTRRLLVRATAAQIEQIRTLLQKMGEAETDATATASGNVRMIPLTGPAARSVLERIEEIWPTMRKNRIRVVTPSSSIPTFRPGSPIEVKPLPGQNPPPKVEPQPESPPKSPPKENSAGRLRFGARVFMTAEGVAPPPSESAPAPIIVAPGPGGLMIASEDTEALDEFEELLTTLAGNLMAGNAEITIFYLKHAKAAVAAETLDQIFGGGTITNKEESSGGGSMLGNLAGAALGDGGGVLGALLDMAGDDGQIAPSGAIKITPDSRLNALIVQANPIDLEKIEQLLKIIDQKESPEEILVTPKARVIPVINTQAEQVAEILKEVYRDRMIAGSTGGNNTARRPSPQEFFRMLRGGRGGGSSRGGSSSRSSREDVQKMSLSVDARTNSLIVSAPEALLAEVEQLIRQLDQAAVESNQAVRVVTLRRASADAVQQAISAVAGESVQFGKTTTGRSRTPAARQPMQSSGARRPTGNSRRPTGSRPPGNGRSSRSSQPQR